MPPTLSSVNSVSDIPEQYVNTPIGLLLQYHNLGLPYTKVPAAQMVVGMCMDNRKHLQMPDNFAFIIRTAGAHMRGMEFKISFAAGVGHVRHMALIGHTNCGMVNLHTRKEEFINGLVEVAGWDRQKAEQQFDKELPGHEIKNENDFILSEVERLRVLYPKLVIAPMIYKVEDNHLYMINEEA